MTLRFEHFMFPTRSETQPGAIVCVECKVEKEVTQSGPVMEHEKLVRWEAVSAVTEKGVIQQARDFSGEKAEDFWQHLQRLVRKKSNTWVFTSCAPRTWSLLGLWEKLENEELGLAGSDHREDDDGIGKRQRRRNGLLVLDDPINCAKVRYPEGRGSVTLCDLRNYGFGDGENSADTTQTLAGGFQFACGIITMLDEGNLGALQITTAAQSMYTFRHSFLTDTILCHTHPQVMRLEDAAYVGGRSECYRLGKVSGRVWHLDFSSMYGNCCLHERLPIRLSEYIGEREPGDDFSEYAKEGYIAAVELDTDMPCFPMRHGGYVYYPIGTFRTVLTGQELKYAAEHNYITRVFERAKYECSPALRVYAGYWLRKRKDCDRIGRSDLANFCKRMLVSIVGKLGQRGRVWADVDDIESDHPYETWKQRDPDGKWVRYRAVAWNVQRQEESIWGPFAVPAAAGWITSAARMTLWKAMLTAQPHNVYYAEVDSMFVNDKGLHNLEDGGWIRDGIPGFLRVVEQCKGAEFRGYQSYTAGSKTVCSGMPKNASGTYAPEGYAWFRAWLHESMKTHQRPNASKKLTRYRDDRDYKHGRVRPDGIVEPWVLPQDLKRVLEK